MVISLNDKPRKLRQWYKRHVYIIYKFRVLYSQREGTSSDPRERKVRERKMRHLQKKIEQHTNHGEFLGLSGEQIRKLNLAIIEEIKKGKSPQAIIKILINDQK